MEQLCTSYNTEGLVPIQGYIRWLQQLLVQQEWDGEYDKAEITQRELSHVMDYQEQTGSLYYPMF
jgi:hypothetical protein